MIRTVSLEVGWNGDPACVQASVWQAAAPAVPLRWAVTGVMGATLRVEAALLEGPLAKLLSEREGSSIGEADRRSETRKNGLRGPEGGPLNRLADSQFVAVQILPTGIGLETGGYAGDGTPSTNLLAAAADMVITHPNAVNAAALNWAAENVAFVEGRLLDSWLAGRIGLIQPRSNTIGLLVDRGVRQAGGLTLIENAANAFRSVAGGRLIQRETDDPLALRLGSCESGASGGSLENPEVLIEASRRLIASGAEAIAIVADFTNLLTPDNDQNLAAYLQGQGPDPIGGLEAILSHLITAIFNIPAAHAPFLWPSRDPCDSRAAAEELGTTFLPCVLKGLWKAPRPSDSCNQAPDVVVAPEGALGGPGVLAAASRGIPIIAVNNPSTMLATSKALDIFVLEAGNYLEAAGLVLALRAGLDPGRFRKKQGAPSTSI